MIKHIYLFRLKNPADTDEVVRKLYSLREHVPQIKELEIGVDFKHAANSYEICEYITFDNRMDYEAFGLNAYHDSIRKYMAEKQLSGIKIDYEV